MADLTVRELQTMRVHVARITRLEDMHRRMSKGVMALRGRTL